MSIDAAVLEHDFEALRRCRHDRSQPWRWCSIEQLSRWALVIAPTLFWAELMVLSYAVHPHGLSGLTQQIAAVAYATVVVGTMLSRPGLARRSRASGLLLVGLTSGICLATIGPAVAGILSTLGANSLFFGPMAVSAFAALDCFRSVRAVRTAPLGWLDTGWVYLGMVAALFLGLWSSFWPRYMIS